MGSVDNKESTSFGNVSNNSEKTQAVDNGRIPENNTRCHLMEDGQHEVCSSEQTAAVIAAPVQESHTVPECTYSRSNHERYLGSIQSKAIVRGIIKPLDLNLHSSRPTIGHESGDVVLNLTEFLTYTQRNKYDVIPISRENQSVISNLPRLGTGHDYMILGQQHFPRDFSAAAVAAHPTTEFVSFSGLPSRNSILAPHMYHIAEELQPPTVDFNAPPPYEMPVKLPSYEEVQREKALEGQMLPSDIVPAHLESNSPGTLPFLAIDTEMGANNDPEFKLLGTDFMFAIAFFLALVFNWIGFLLLMCFCRTVASRYGALSGFGLSLAKWTIIVKNSTDIPMNNAWLWWLITAFGLLICIRSLCQYVNIKRGWHLMSAVNQERVLYFH